MSTGASPAPVAKNEPRHAAEILVRRNMMIGATAIYCVAGSAGYRYGLSALHLGLARRGRFPRYSVQPAILERCHDAGRVRAMKIAPARVPPKSTFTKSGVFADNIKRAHVHLTWFIWRSSS